MADSVLMKNRDYSEVEIAEDDPLMELSRIIGLEPRRDPPLQVRELEPFGVRQEPVFAPAPAFKHVIAEEPEVELQPEFSDELQQDLADELSASLEAEDDFLEVPTSVDFAPEVHPGAEDHLHQSAAEIPVPHIMVSFPQPVVQDDSLSLEDELEAMLNPVEHPATPFGFSPVLDEVEFEQTPSSTRAAFDDFDARIVEPSDIQAPNEDARIDMNFDAEPAFDEIEPLAEEPAWLKAAPIHVAPAVEEASSKFDEHYEASEPYLESEMVVEEAQQYESVAEVPEPADAFDAPSSSIADRLYEHVVAVQELEPIVEAVIHETRTVEVTDAFDIPDFEYQDPDAAPTVDSAHSSYEDIYEPVAYSKPVTAAVVTPPVAQYDEADFDQINGAIADLENERAHAMHVESRNDAAAPIALAAKRDDRTEFIVDSDDDFAASLDIPSAPRAMPKHNSGRSYFMAAGIGALALLAGIGAYAWTTGPTSSTTASAPVVIKADVEPVKIAPENPGGKVVPNQDIAVYNKVGGANPEAVAQKSLVSKTEEPVDLIEKTAARVVLPGPALSEPEAQVAKAEDRVDAASTNEASEVQAEVASVPPKKVRTMVVKSDGSLVERAAAAPEVTAAVKPILVKPLAEAVIPIKTVATKPIVVDEAVGAVAKIEAETPEVAQVGEPVVLTRTPVASEEVKVAALEPDATEAIAKVGEPEATEAPLAKPLVKAVKLKKITQEAANAEAVAELAAVNIPLVDARPAEQPVTIVAKTGKTPSAVPASTGGNYVIQIASTPSPDAAQSTYSTLSRKFGSVIGGRAMNIQQADIPGKGTFYRVRIAAGSKAEAAALCAKYKSAGGQCLVAR